MKTETKIAGLTMALALSAGSVAQGAALESEQASAVSLLKSLRAKPVPGKSVELSYDSTKKSEGIYSGFTDRIIGDGVYTGMTDRIIGSDGFSK